jgi:hypothetical protein
MALPFPFTSNDEWFWLMAQFVSISGSLLFIARQVRGERMATMLTALDSLNERWNGSTMARARHRVAERFRSGGSSSTMDEADHRIASFFNEVGTLVELGVLDRGYVWSRMSFYIEHYWPILKPGVEEFRKTSEDQTWFKGFQHLHSIVSAISARYRYPRGLRWVHRFVQHSPPDYAALQKFFATELDSTAPPALAAATGASDPPSAIPFGALNSFFDWVRNHPSGTASTAAGAHKRAR